MKEQLMNEVLQAMLPYVNNQQGEKLVSELHSIFERYDITKAEQASNYCLATIIGSLLLAL